MTKTQWTLCWADLTASFGEPCKTQEENDARFLVYLKLVGDLADAVVAPAVVRACRECQRFPTVREIIERVPGRLNESEAAEAAWQRVLSSARNGPTRYNPAIGTRPTGADLDQLDLSAIGHAAGLYRIWECENDSQQMGFIRRDFLATYKDIAHMASNNLLPTGEPARPKIEAPRGGGIKRIGGEMLFLDSPGRREDLVEREEGGDE